VGVPRCRRSEAGTLPWREVDGHRGAGGGRGIWWGRRRWRRQRLGGRGVGGGGRVDLDGG
jgi:hypothetical protein